VNTISYRSSSGLSLTRLFFIGQNYAINKNLNVQYQLNPAVLIGRL